MLGTQIYQIGYIISELNLLLSLDLFSFLNKTMSIIENELK